MLARPLSSPFGRSGEDDDIVMSMDDPFSNPDAFATNPSPPSLEINPQPDDDESPATGSPEFASPVSMRDSPPRTCFKTPPLNLLALNHSAGALRSVPCSGTSPDPFQLGSGRGSAERDDDHAKGGDVDEEQEEGEEDGAAAAAAAQPRYNLRSASARASKAQPARASARSPNPLSLDPWGSASPAASRSPSRSPQAAALGRDGAAFASKGFGRSGLLGSKSSSEASPRVSCENRHPNTGVEGGAAHGLGGSRERAPAAAQPPASQHRSTPGQVSVWAFGASLQLSDDVDAATRGNRRCSEGFNTHGQRLPPPPFLDLERRAEAEAGADGRWKGSAAPNHALAAPTLAGLGEGSPTSSDGTPGYGNGRSGPAAARKPTGLVATPSFADRLDATKDDLAMSLNLTASPNSTPAALQEKPPAAQASAVGARAEPGIHLEVPPKKVWGEAEAPLALLAYEAAVRVCLVEVVRASTPWAKVFLGDGDCLPLQRSFCISNRILQRLQPTKDSISLEGQASTKHTITEPRSRELSFSLANHSSYGPPTTCTKDVNSRQVSAMGVERRIRVEVKSVVFNQKPQKDYGVLASPNWNPLPWLKSLSASKHRKRQAPGDASDGSPAQASTGCHMLYPFKKRKTALEDACTDGDQDGRIPSPSLHTDPTLPDDLDAENEDLVSNYSKENHNAGTNKAPQTPQTSTSRLRSLASKPPDTTSKWFKNIDLAQTLFSSPYNMRSPGGSRHPRQHWHAAEAEAALQCKVYLTREEGARVGESQFVTLDSAHNTAEFVRPDDGEVCLHFEMADRATSKDKGMCSTQLPLAALDGRKTVLLFKNKKEIGKLELGIVEEERIVSLKGEGTGQDPVASEDNTTDRGQDESQLLKVYDLVVKVALHQEGFKARKLSLTGPWESLLDAFAKKHAVRESYCQLRYLLHVMDATICTPTADCFTILLKKLRPLVEMQLSNKLPELENNMLLSVRQQVGELLTFAFQHYKALMEVEPTGMAPQGKAVPGSALPAPALAIAVELLRLLSQDTSRGEKEVKDYLLVNFKKAAQLIFQARQNEAEGASSASVGATTAQATPSAPAAAPFSSGSHAHTWIRARRGSESSSSRDNTERDNDKSLLQRGGAASSARVKPPGASDSSARPAAPAKAASGSLSDRSHLSTAGATAASPSVSKSGWGAGGAVAASIHLGMAATAERADPAAADHSRLVHLARLVAQEVKTDIIIHDAVKSLQFVKMPCITAHEHCKQLRDLVRAMLSSRPPKAPSVSVINLMYAIDDLQRKLVGEWKIGGGLEKKLNVPELFSEYMQSWLKRTQAELWTACHDTMGIRIEGEPRDFPAGVDILYKQTRLALKGTGSSYDRILQRWPQYLTHVEAAICDVESRLMQALLDDCGGAVKTSTKTGAMQTALAARELAKNLAAKNLKHMSAALKTVAKRAAPTPEKQTLHPALARNQTAREPAPQATQEVAVSHDAEAGITAEELLLPRKWKVVLVTLRMMLDMRPEIEQMLRAYEQKPALSDGRSTTEKSTTGAPDDKGRQKEDIGKVPFGTRFSTNTGGVRHHYMRHIKFVVENIHREIGRCRATSIFAILQQPNLADLDLAEVLTPLKELLGTVFITLYEVLGNGHVIVTVLRGIWDNLAFDVLCHLEEDENRDWRKSLLVGQLMMDLDNVLLTELRLRSNADIPEREYPSHVKKIHNVLQTSKETKDSFDMYS